MADMVVQLLVGVLRALSVIYNAVMFIPYSILYKPQSKLHASNRLKVRKQCYQFAPVGHCSVNHVSCSSEPCDVSYDFSWYPTQNLPLVLICSFLLCFLPAAYWLVEVVKVSILTLADIQAFPEGCLWAIILTNHTFFLHISLFYQHLQLHTLLKDWRRFVNYRSYGQFSQEATGLWGNQGVNIFASLLVQQKHVWT